MIHGKSISNCKRINIVQVLCSDLLGTRGACATLVRASRSALDDYCASCARRVTEPQPAACTGGPCMSYAR